STRESLRQLSISPSGHRRLLFCCPRRPHRRRSTVERTDMSRSRVATNCAGVARTGRSVAWRQQTRSPDSAETCRSVQSAPTSSYSHDDQMMDDGCPRYLDSLSAVSTSTSMAIPVPVTMSDGHHATWGSRIRCAPWDRMCTHLAVLC
ncbi:unnamed protein product, partial [Mycena citricolor]